MYVEIPCPLLEINEVMLNCQYSDSRNVRFLYTSNVADVFCCYSNNNPYCHVQDKTVSVTALVMRSYHCHGNRNIKFVCCGVFVSHYSLRLNQLTDTGAIALARALQHNKSLEELK